MEHQTLLQYDKKRKGLFWFRSLDKKEYLEVTVREYRIEAREKGGGVFILTLISAVFMLRKCHDWRPGERLPGGALSKFPETAAGLWPPALTVTMTGNSSGLPVPLPQ